MVRWRGNVCRGGLEEGGNSLYFRRVIEKLW